MGASKEGTRADCITQATREMVQKLAEHIPLTGCEADDVIKDEVLKTIDNDKWSQDSCSGLLDGFNDLFNAVRTHKAARATANSDAHDLFVTEEKAAREMK